MSECRSSSCGSFVWFLAGLGVGVAVGMLYAPRPGDETREQWFQKADEGREVFVNRAKQAAEQVDKFLASFGLSPSSRSRVTTSDNRQAPLPFEGGSKNSWDQV